MTDSVEEIAAASAGDALPIPRARTSVSIRARVRVEHFFFLCTLTLGALLVHGYHPAVEDAEIYLPGILKLLHPSLFPRNAQFFLSHAGLTLFPNLIAGSISLTHFSVGAMLLAWHLLTIFLLLFACWRVARLCFEDEHAAWCGVTLVASLLTIPIAGTALYLMDQYLTSRSLSTPCALLAIASVLEGRYGRAALWIGFTAAVHPLMAVFAGAYLIIFWICKHMPVSSGWAFALIPTLFPPVTPAYRAVLNAHPYFLLSNWAWYEWVGIVAPFALLAVFERVARSREFGPMALACRALIAFEALFLALALVISMPGRFENFSELQPMRCLHLLYCLMFLFAGGLMGRFVLAEQRWRWAVFFIPICSVMFLAQSQLFPATAHVEWPGVPSTNPWVQAFDWIRTHTPEDAYFALDPEHEKMPAEDEHGFRALAERSMLADAGKDSGAVSMFPALADVWWKQVNAAHNWKLFRRADFQKLKRQYGVNWVVIQRPNLAGLACTYQNSLVSVCRIQ